MLIGLGKLSITDPKQPWATMLLMNIHLPSYLGAFSTAKAHGRHGRPGDILAALSAIVFSLLRGWPWGLASREEASGRKGAPAGDDIIRLTETRNAKAGYTACV